MNTSAQPVLTAVRQIGPKGLLSGLGVFVLTLTVPIFGATRAEAKNGAAGRPLYTYTLAQDGTPQSYDEALAVACLQGIINRKGPELYVLSRKNTRPQYWLDLLSKEGRWLQG